MQLDAEKFDILFLAPITAGHPDTANLLELCVVSVDHNAGVITLADKRNYPRGQRSFLISDSGRICLQGIEYVILLNDQESGHFESLNQHYA